MATTYFDDKLKPMARSTFMTIERQHTQGQAERQDVQGVVNFNSLSPRRESYLDNKIKESDNCYASIAQKEKR